MPTSLPSNIVSGTPKAGPTLPAQVAVNSFLPIEAAGRGPQSLSPRLVIVFPFGESVPSNARALPPVVVSLSLLPEAAAASPRTFAGRTLPEGILFAAAARTGRVAPPGSTAPPLVSTDIVFRPSAVTLGPLSRTSRTAPSVLLTEAATRQPLSLAVKLAASALFSQAVCAGQRVPAPLPQAVDTRDPFVVMATELRFLFASLTGNPMTSAQTTLAILDKLAASYRVNELSLLANTLTALPTLIRGGDGIASTVYGYGQDSPILTLLPAADQMIAQSSPNTVLAAIYRPIMAALASYASKLGFPSLDAYLSSLNAPVPMTALVHPNAALINWLYMGQQGPLLLSPKNVFAPQTLFGTATVQASGGLAFSHLSAIPAANSVSSTPGQSLQGYTGAKGCTANASAPISGGLSVTLTAAGQNAAGQPVAGRTWTADLSNAPAGASVPFVPAVAGDRIYDVTAAVGIGPAASGAFSLNSVLERIVS